MTLLHRTLLISLLVLPGCYAHYPQRWEPLAPGLPYCSSISGIYNAKGSGSRSLAPRVLADEKSQLENAERVELHVEDGIFTVTVHSVDKQLQSKQFREDKGEYSCDDGKIRMSHVIADGFGARRNRVVLSKTLSGALVVEDAGEGLGFYLVPLAGSEFLRFEPY